MSKTIESVSASISPVDDRCKWWSKVIRNGTTLPLPSTIEGASDIPGPFLKKGEEELCPGDVVIHGEEVHHRKARGWTYSLGYMTADGDTNWVQPTREHKQALKEAGMDVALLQGSGELAACARLAQGLRAGLDAGIPAMATGPVQAVEVDAPVVSSSYDFMAGLQASAEGANRDSGLSA